MKKLTVAVLFGGCSDEYAISLKSAYSVIKHMDVNIDAVMVGITPAGEWFRFTGELGKIDTDTWHNEADCVRAIISPSRDTSGLLEFRNGGINVIKLDAAFPILHGKNGEDGTLQGLLELAGIPVIGCRTLSSAICMNKDTAHKLAGIAGVKTPRSFVLDCMDSALALQQAEAIGYPLFVKPLRAGSSLGITKVNKWENLISALKQAFKYDSAVIVEEAIEGFEVGCAVLGDDDFIIGAVDEIALTCEFFDYKEKYSCSREASSIHVPARIPYEKSEEIRGTAKIIYKALYCSGFARVDMFLTPEGEIYFNEVNTIPGLTDCSRFPNMLKAAGMTFEQTIKRAIDKAVGI